MVARRRRHRASRAPPVVVASDRRSRHQLVRVGQRRAGSSTTSSICRRGGGDQNFGPGLFSVRRDGSERACSVGPGAAHSECVSIDSQLGRNHGLLFVLRETAATKSSSANITATARRLDRHHPETPRRRPPVVSQYSFARLPPSSPSSWVFDPPRRGPRGLQPVRDGITEVFWRRRARDEWRSLAKRASPRLAVVSRVAVDCARRSTSPSSTADSTSVLTRFDFKTASSGARRRSPSAPGFDFAARRLMSERQEWSACACRPMPRRPSGSIARAQDASGARRQTLPRPVNRIACGRCTGDGVVARPFVLRPRRQATSALSASGRRSGSTVGSVRPAVDPRGWPRSTCIASRRATVLICRSG